MSSLRAVRRVLTATQRALPLRPAIHSNSALIPGISYQTSLRLLHNSSSSRQKNPKRDDTTNENAKDTPAVSARFERKSNPRSTTSKSTLRRVAASDRKNSTADENDTSKPPTQICTAFCTAEKYNLRQCNSLLKAGGYVPDPMATGLGDEVIHLRIPLPPQARRHFPIGADAYGDIFVFPSGNIVSWGLPEAIITSVAALIRPAAESPHSTTETETLEFVEDPSRHNSFLKGDVIIIGTGARALEENRLSHISLDSMTSMFDDTARATEVEEDEESSRRQSTPIVLAKVAFSSGLARSTKLAVLEEMLENYIESTSSIPVLLSQGSRLPFTRSFILRKTGELLSFRARLNLYSELTDSLPDIFWDSRKELGLEGYYESVGRELDVGVRIRQLNEKLDYASEMAAVLRERLSERHGLVLEWMIIILITIEVGFEILHLWKDSKTEQKWEEMEERNITPGPPPRPGYPQYMPHEYHQHHQHPYSPYHQPRHAAPQQHYPPQAQDGGNRMDDIDAALRLLDGIIARVSAQENFKQRQERDKK